MSANTPDTTATDDVWAADDPDACERLFHETLSEGDAEGVMAALTLMALCDPHRAGRLLEDLKTALHIANGGDFRFRLERA